MLVRWRPPKFRGTFSFGSYITTITVSGGGAPAAASAAVVVLQAMGVIGPVG